MRRTLLLLLAALALLAAGCGSDDDESSTSPSTSASTQSGEPATEGADEPVVVEMRNIQFEPKEVTVDAGETIRWENLDTVDHDAVSTSGDEFESDQFGKGGTFEYTPEQPGTIEYECTLHPGMVGTIEVR